MHANLMPDNPRKTAFKVLAGAEGSGRINDLLHRILERSSFTEQDRRFITELVMGATRMQARLDADLAACYRGRYAHLERGVKRLLRLGAYQLHYMDAVPSHAALSTTVALAREVNLARAAGLVNGVLRQLTRQPQRMDPAESDSVDDLAATFSHPVWLVERWLACYGHDLTVALMRWNNQRPTIWLRQRPDPQSQERLAKMAASMGVTLRPHPELPDYLAAGKSPATLLEAEVLGQGLFLVQDPSAGAVIEAVDPQPGATIIDLCAGPGGKTAALADKVGPEGRILTYEIDHHRVGMINDTTHRLGLENVDLYPGDATSQSLPPADTILVDVPCTGTGVMSRRADLRWRRQPQHVAELAAIQRSLLEHAARYLKPKGILVYATCSLEPEENWQQIDAFQEKHPRFCLLPMPGTFPAEWIDARGALSTFPPEHHADGTFAVRLQAL